MKVSLRRLVLLIAILSIVLCVFVHATAAAHKTPNNDDLYDNDDDAFDYDDDDESLVDDRSSQPAAAASSSSSHSTKKSNQATHTTTTATSSNSPSHTQPSNTKDGDEESDDDDDEDDSDYVTPAERNDGPKRSSDRAPNKPPKVTFGAMEKQNYWAEVAAIVFIIVYIINFFVGKSTNERIARQWFESFKGLFDTQFAAIGAYEGADASSNGNILKESQSCFKFYASGRRYCSGLLATIDLRKRQDLFSLALALIDLSTMRDTVTIEIPMNDDDMQPFVFAIARRRLEKKMRRTYKDIENYAGTIKSTRVPQAFCVLTDSSELERELLDDRVARTLEQFNELFISLHFTDQNTSGSFSQQASLANGVGAYVPDAPSKKLLRFKFALPNNALANMDQLRTLLEMTVHFIDRVAAIQLSAQARQRALDNRKKVAEKAFRATHAQRQEAALKRKEELKRREESNPADLTPEQLRRREEAQQRALLKKRQPKVKVIR